MLRPDNIPRLVTSSKGLGEREKIYYFFTAFFEIFVWETPGGFLEVLTPWVNCSITTFDFPFPSCKLYIKKELPFAWVRNHLNWKLWVVKWVNGVYYMDIYSSFILLIELCVQFFLKYIFAYRIALPIKLHKPAIQNLYFQFSILISNKMNWIFYIWF